MLVKLRHQRSFLQIKEVTNFLVFCINETPKRCRNRKVGLCKYALFATTALAKPGTASTQNLTKNDDSSKRFFSSAALYQTGAVPFQTHSLFDHIFPSVL
jgi:hypothetical protein